MFYYLVDNCIVQNDAIMKTVNEGYGLQFFTIMIE